ncbi:hypothetical protein [Pseudoalteromonas sp. MER144-MNA-CIBAN-0113]|uniref:hypothetical protein n=1 Tax=Pseudoalteromonas sp. MER144-MNA-CIBAN-0113 TaxID=3140429 RepID=UPI0033288352
MEIGIFTVTITGVLLTALIIKYLTFRPERVFSDIGENVLLCKKPHWFNNNKSRMQLIPKGAIIKIQLASNTVTLFCKSGNVIDIPVPNSKFTADVLQSAKTHFDKAEVVILDN